jgi:diguanylate cyclase (GGDEF)-like protein
VLLSLWDPTLQNPLVRGLLIGLISILAIFCIPLAAPSPLVTLALALLVGILQGMLLVTWMKSSHRANQEALHNAQQDLTRVQREASKTKQAMEEYKDKIVKSSTTLASLAAIAKVTGQSLDLNKVLGSIMETVGSIGATKASIWLLESDGRLRLANNLGWPESDHEVRCALGEGIIGWVAQHGHAVDSQTIRHDPNLMDVQKKSNYPSILAVPLMNNQETLGVLHIGTVDRRRIRDEGLKDEKRMIHFLGGLAAMSIKNAKVFGATKEFAEKDGLTGLYNHRYYQDTMDREMKRSDRYGDPLSVLMTDIDKFKSFNDTYGHQVGDEVLAGTAQIMADVARDSDIACRYGGEEFILILPQTDKNGAALVAERLRKTIEETIYDTEKGKLKVTLSVGVGTFPEDSRDKEVLVRLCDEALYRAKEAGRNRVELAYPEGVLPPGNQAPSAPSQEILASPPISASPPAPQPTPALRPPAHPILSSTDQATLARAQVAAIGRAKQLAQEGNTQGAREAAALAKAIATRRTQAMVKVVADPNLVSKAKAAARIAAARQQGQAAQDPNARAAKARQTAAQGVILPPGPPRKP